MSATPSTREIEQTLSGLGLILGRIDGPKWDHLALLGAWRRAADEIQRARGGAAAKTKEAALRRFALMRRAEGPENAMAQILIIKEWRQLVQRGALAATPDDARLAAIGERRSVLMVVRRRRAA